MICRSYPYDFAVPDFSETQKGSPTKIFGKVRQKFLKKNRDKSRLLLSEEILRNQKFSELPKCFRTNFFGTVKPENINRELWSPLKICKFFRYPIFFWNTEVLPYEIFRFCETQILTKNRDTPLFSYAEKNSDTRSFLKHRRVPLRNFWTLWDNKLVAENSNIPILCLNFFHNRLFVKHRRVPLRIFSVLWDRKLSIENSEIPSLSVRFFDSRFFPKQKRVAIRFFLGLWDTYFDKNSWYTPLFSYPWKFSIPEVFWNTQGSPYYLFQNCETKTLTKNCETSPSSLIHKNFDTRIFLKHRRLFLRYVSVRLDKTVCTENRDTRPLSYH